jgi:hypothetical protein
MSAALEARGRGVYEKAGWHMGMPGTYGLVIGISDYTYLRGAETYGLDKLFVSALTAYRFFEWLRDQFAYRETPLVKCWLLLAPTADEIAVEPALASVGAPANFDDCASAIGHWYKALKAVTVDPKDASGSIFFFSGHGFEVTKQLLLPRDYLHPDYESVNRAISTANIYDALLYTTMQRHFLFIDACRNDTSKLRTADRDITGERILNVPLGKAPRTQGFEKILYASAPGEQTWQLDDVSQNEGMSFYGRALVDGLRKEQGNAPLPMPDKSRVPWAIPFENLFLYMARTLSEQLKPHGIYTVNPIVEDGARQSPPPPVVAHIPISERGAGIDLGERTDTGQIAGDVLAGSASAAEPRLDIVTSSLGAAGVLRAFKSAMDHVSSVAVRRSIDYASLLDEPVPVQHNAFGSERITDFFRGARIFDITTARGVDEPLVVGRVQRSEDARVHVTAVRLPAAFSELPEHRLWIEFPGDDASFAVIVPASPMTFAVKTVRQEAHSLSIVEFQVDLGAKLPPILVEAVGLLSRASTVTAEELDRLERNLGTIHPATPNAHLAAAISAWLRIQTAGFAGIESAPYDRFATECTSSDLLVVELERLLRTDSSEGAPRAQDLVQQATRLGMPLLSGIKELLLGQMELLSQPDLEAEWQDVRNAMRESFGAALAFQRKGGTFATYAYTEGALARAWDEARAVLQQRQVEFA